MKETGVRMFDLHDAAWVQHDRFPAILVKVLENRASHPGLSLMLVEVAVGGVIETHHHDMETETAVVMAGQGLLTWDDDQHETWLAWLAPGEGITVRPRTPHTLLNVGDEPLQLLAIHSPPVR
jgi:mannose-6-phosphate isomerase-like protein (cupin superfamily)